MKLVYDLVLGPDTANVTGGGTTVWPATLTTVCPNGTLTLATAAQATWWPVSSTPVTATDGVLDATVGNALGTATIHLLRE
jgi:hypothetical protein